MRTYKIQINNKGNIIYSTVTVQSPAGTHEALQLAEAMYGGPGIKIKIIA